MAKISVLKGATSVLVRIFVQDATVTTGAGKTGLTSASFTGTKCYVARDDDGNAAGTAVTLTDSTRGTWSSGGIKEKDSTNMPGVYELGLTNASLATGSRTCTYFLGGTNLAPVVLEVELTGWDNQDAVHGGMSCLPNTAVTTNASLLTSGTGTDQLSVSSGRIDIGKALGTAVTLDSNNVLNVSTKYLAGTALTGRDIGASVLLSTGTGTGQLDFTSGVVKANATQWLGGTIPAVNVTGVPLVDTKYLLGTIFSTPATAGILDVNIKNMNNIATTSITTINANQGTTQPINFTGTAGSALVKSDMVDIAGSAVSTSSAQIGTNVVNAGGTAWASGSLTSGVFGAGAINAAAINADTGLILRANTATASAAGSLTLDAGASSVDNYYKDCWLVITSSTGIAQARRISSYVGSTKVASVSPNWSTTPSSSSTFTILPYGRVDIDAILGTASTGTAGYIGIDWSAVNAPTSTVGLSGTTIGTLTTYTGNTVQTGDSYARLGAPAGASIAADLAEIEAETDGIAAIPTSNPSAAAIATAVWQDNTAGDFTTASSIGKSLYTSGNVPGAASGLFIAGTNAATSITTGLTAHIIGTVDTLTTYTGNTPQTGDSYARIGAPVGATISADIAEIEGETDSIISTLGSPSGASVSADIASIQTDTTAIRAKYKKNTAHAKFQFTMQDSTTGADKTGLTVAGQVNIDGAGFGNLTNAVSELANGWYTVDLAAADLNGTNIALQFKATGAITKDLVIVTQL